MRTEPTGPGLPFDQVNLLKLLGAQLVEVLIGRGLPILLATFEISVDGGLGDAELFGDRRLGRTLQIEFGDLMTALFGGEAAVFRGRHDYVLDGVSEGVGRLGGQLRCEDSFCLLSRELFISQNDCVAVQLVELHYPRTSPRLLARDKQ